jgi:hypothetical protein
MVQIAARTLVTFDQAVRHDQGSTFRGWLGRVLPHIGDAYRTDEDGFRSHMGASTIGRECAREIWYSFRWFTRKQFNGQMLRLFNRGHLEEGRFIALMLASGFNVIQQDEHGKQFRISEAGGHYGGSGDGMFDGCPDLPSGQRALCEFKTHNDKSFTKLAGKNWKEYHEYLLGHTKAPVTFTGDGVRTAKFEHWVQMQQYMRKQGHAVGVYFAVNKDNDLIYAEVVPLDSEAADKFIHRAIQIIPMHAPPSKLAATAGDYRCKFCDHRPVCHLGAPAERNCRTCEWSYPDMEDGRWYCQHPDVTSVNPGPQPLDKARQLAACGSYSRNSKAF